MLTKNEIFELIKTNETPFWKLMLSKGYNTTVNIGSYNLENVGKDATIDEKVKKSCQALDFKLKIFDDAKDTKFAITMSNAKTSNQDGILGPFEFVIDAEYKNNNQQFNNIEGLGYISSDRLSEMLSIEREKSKIELEKALLERDKRDMKKQLSLKDDELQGIISKNESGTEKLANVIVKAAEKGYSVLMDGNGGNLAGVKDNKVREDEEEKSEEQIIVEEIATNIFNEIKDKEKLKKVKVFVEQFIEKIKSTNGIRTEKNED
ncbi:MAG: hypothetical protein KAT68_00685 [Bacteroidales bacterium]|nr:hypothetical protein [Bacteroidales bacterium]